MKPLIFGLWLGLIMVAMAAPARDIPNKLPDIAGETNWGTLSQVGDGRKITITGNAHWEATGEIRKDGSVYVLWILTETGQPAPGVYRIDGTDLIGVWGWSNNVTHEADGTLTGALMEDTIRKVEP